MKLRRTKRNALGDVALIAATALALILVIGSLAVIVFDVGIHGYSRLSWAFLTESPDDGMMGGGIFPAIVGTTLMVFLMTLAGVPIGVATAVYLHEYAAPDSRFAKLVRLAVQNLAGVPSIVFGLFGLGFFIQWVGPGIDRFVLGGARVFGQPGILWASLTMAVLTLPVVIVATEEALSAVPNSVREAAFALGATKFQVVATVVVPQSLAGILTGGILAVSRGAGEVAPLLFTGAAYFLPELPSRLSDQFMHLGYHVYVLSTQSPNVDATEPILYATVLVLLALVFMLNLAAMVARSRMRRHYA
ncbi:MAG: phosphate ABC transporter permease PstA [Deltaproteobacteria bacterium]|nr:phosphate ABC transporter permease PstA [Deltaproteobacteria bacterium]